MGEFSNSINSLVFGIISYLIISVGYMKIFEKCGVEKKWGIIPVVREYQLSLCADREPDGRVCTILTAIAYVTRLTQFCLPKNSVGIFLLAIVTIAVNISIVVYMARIYIGLTKVFGQSKRWAWLFLIIEWTLLIWAFSPKYMPKKKVVNVNALSGAKEAGMEVEAINAGLTINIKERTAIDFFRKKTLIKDIHMSIPKGHMVLLLGGSGAGKTTYLNAVTGYEKANASIQLGENDVYEDYSKIMYDIGFVPQQDLMRGNDTVHGWPRCRRSGSYPR